MRSFRKFSIIFNLVYVNPTLSKLHSKILKVLYEYSLFTKVLAEYFWLIAVTQESLYLILKIYFWYDSNPQSLAFTTILINNTTLYGYLHIPGYKPIYPFILIEYVKIIF